MLKKHKLAFIAIASVICMAAECVMSVEKIVLPENAKINNEEEITVEVKLVPGSDETSKMAFAILTPKSWKTAQNAKLTFSTVGYASQGQAEITDEAMELIPSTEVEPSTQLSWPMAYQSKVGFMGNTGPVEWTVFRSASTFVINDNVSKEPIKAIVKIRLTTGPDNIKFFFAAGYTGAKRGLMTEQENSGDFRYVPNETAVPFRVSGGYGPSLDYTVKASVTTTPSVFRYGDIFAVNFGSAESSLSAESKIYLCGKVVLEDGTTKTVETPSEATLMLSQGDKNFQKYIYPRHFFGLPNDAKIEAVYVWFVNSDKSIVVKEGDGYHLAQSNQ